jgi:DNA invertase Pin-like site-specific DNA recombinase
MLRCAVYCRVSSEDQAERGTIENQVEFATKYCDLHQLKIVCWYKDEGVTGTLPLEKRPEGEKMLNDIKKQKFNLLLIYRLDRLGRSARIILNAVHELEEHGVKIRSMTEPFDTSDPNGRFLLTILAGVADLERETVLERMWLGANRAARAGKWLGLCLLLFDCGQGHVFGCSQRECFFYPGIRQYPAGFVSMPGNGCYLRPLSGAIDQCSPGCGPVLFPLLEVLGHETTCL